MSDYNNNNNNATYWRMCKCCVTYLLHPSSCKLDGNYFRRIRQRMIFICKLKFGDTLYTLRGILRNGIPLTPKSKT